VEFVFIRHAESQYNVRLTENLDSRLTDAGYWQVKSLATWLKQNWPSISSYEGLVSPYWRCLETARLLREECGINFTVDPGPMEIRIYRYHPLVPRRADEFPMFNWDLYPEDMALKRETIDEYMGRMEGFLATFGQEGPHPGKKWWERWLVISHGTPCQTMAEMAAGIHEIPTDFDKVKNCSISWVDQGEMIYFNKVVYGDFGGASGPLCERSVGVATPGGRLDVPGPDNGHQI